MYEVNWPGKFAHEMNVLKIEASSYRIENEFLSLYKGFRRIASFSPGNWYCIRELESEGDDNA